MKQENRCTDQIRVLSGFSQIPKICWILVCEILSPKMFKLILVSLGVWLSISLNAQVINSQSLESVERNKRNTSFNLEEIKVRWKKAALENCQGIPCVIAPSFTCGTTTVSDIDGNTYNTVSIGTQCWTKQNLKVTKYNDGTLITLDASGGSSGNGVGVTWSATPGKYTIYENESSTGSNATNYGFLYNWYAAAGIITSVGSPTKNICPLGWHVPTDAEWTYLVNFLLPDSETKLKENSTLWTTNTGSDAFGFSARPGGVRDPNGFFAFKGSGAFYWSSTVDDINATPPTAFSQNLDNNNSNQTRFPAQINHGYSVRCLKN